MMDASQHLLVHWVHQAADNLKLMTREDVEAVIQYHVQREESFDALKPLLAAVTVQENQKSYAKRAESRVSR